MRDKCLINFRTWCKRLVVNEKQICIKSSAVCLIVALKNVTLQHLQIAESPPPPPVALGGRLVSAHQDRFQCRKSCVTFWHVPWHFGNGVQAHKRGPLGEKAGRCCYQRTVQSNFWSVFFAQICLHATDFGFNGEKKKKTQRETWSEKLPTINCSLDGNLSSQKRTSTFWLLSNEVNFCLSFFLASAAMWRVIQPDMFELDTDSPPETSVSYLRFVRIVSVEHSEIAIYACGHYRIKETAQKCIHSHISPPSTARVSKC